MPHKNHVHDIYKKVVHEFVRKIGILPLFTFEKEGERRSELRGDLKGGEVSDVSLKASDGVF